ncbi:MAG TPA: hypothetical protein VM582_02165, partial [Candidatus Thermoplasmatota archaeon]|nr:hypothetical protein [Candidatus Thermoplasmatota archaeon]
TSPGAALAWADCQSRRGLTPAVKQLDRDGALDRPFPATPFGHGDSPGLLQDDTDRASVTAWDCSMAPVAEANDPQGRREVVVADPTGRLHAERFPLVVPYTLTGIGFVDEDRDPSTPGVFRRALTDDDGTYARIPGFGAPQAQPTASWWVAAERALDGPAGDCDDATPSALAPHYPGRAVESDATPILEARKDRPSLTFTFYDGHRGLHPELDPTTGPLTPSDGGTMVLDHGRGGDGPMWSALARSEQDPQLVNRDDLGFTPALYFTYYAHIGPDGLGFPLPQAASREYGIDNCGSATNGIEKGWVCDSGLWWKDAHGNDVTPRYAQGMRVGRVVGDPYHLRDVDCYDGEIARALGVRASLVDLTSEGACPA